MIRPSSATARYLSMYGRCEVIVERGIYLQAIPNRFYYVNTHTKIDQTTTHYKVWDPTMLSLLITEPAVLTQHQTAAVALSNASKIGCQGEVICLRRYQNTIPSDC